MDEQQVKNCIKNNKITMDNDTLYFDDEYITKKEFVDFMRKKIELDSEDFSEYKKGNGQKSRNRNRKK